MSREAPILVQEESTDSFGLYHPEENIIETYIGNDREELPGEYYGENWHDANEEDLQAEIEASIQDVRSDIEELRGRDLTDDQQQELDRMELRLTSQENVLELAREVQDAE